MIEINKKVENLKKEIDISLNKNKIDLLIKNAKLINTFSGDIYKTDIAVHNGKIVGFGEYSAKNVIDAKGMYVAPGFIDGHVHIESSMVKIPEFAKVVMPCGTTSVVIDPHEIANVLGIEGIKYMLSSSIDSMLGVYVMLPSCVPSTALETSGATLSSHDLSLLLNDERILGIAEVMNYPGVIHKDTDLLKKIAIANGKIIDGHAPFLSGKQLYAYVSSGIRSDHECSEIEEAREKLRAGMYVMIREGTAAKNLKSLIGLVNVSNSRKFIFVTDDRHLDDIENEGHINYLVKKAIEYGVDPVKAIQMATINTAEYFGLKNLGAILPGYFADFIIFDNFKRMNIKMVFKNGIMVSKDGKVFDGIIKEYKEKLRGTINVKWIEHEDFALKAEGKKARVINVIPNEIITKMSVEEVKVDGGYVSSDTEKDILKIAVIERHMASGRIAKGLVRGFKLKKGAIASSISHDSHNIVVIGTHDGDMYQAAVGVVKMQGGIAAALNGQILESLPLPVAGLMSDRSAEFVKTKIKRLREVARYLGSELPDPFMAMSFLTLPPIPEIKITDRGIIDANKFKVVDLFVR
ncbi:MAG: adenine deaminase [Elusimicrobiales bacterium]|nr:adenine deaminase [Elusimicrobiales bacterium]HPO95595.1 adenine deaminase [Elusimicrobiales bacterium]